MFGTDLERNIERNDPTWFTSINTNSQDPLALRARATIGPRAGAETFAAMINGKPEAYEIARTEHLSLPHGQVVDIFIPAGLVPAEERQLIERVIEAARDKHTDIIFQSHKMQSISEVAVSKIEGKDGESVFYLYREAGEFDGLGSHTLNELLWVGLPYAESQSDNELNEGLIEVQDDMEKYQHRYINRRGVRINFELSTQLGSRGYKSIVFREDVRKSEYITVELEHATGSYNYKLDDSFNMILDKDMSSTRFRNQVHYSTLLLLRDYICGVILETEEGEMATAASGPAARIDYLRYLPIGQSSSPTAARNFLTRRKKDLLTKSEERKQFDPQGRSTTYVREVEQTNQNLPPLKIFVNPDDFLYDKIIANGFKLPPNIEA